MECVLMLSLPVCVGVAELLAQPFFVLYFHFTVSSSNVTYHRYTTEIGSTCISAALHMFSSVVLSVAHSKVEGKTALFHGLSYPTTDIYRSFDKIKLSDDGCIWVQMY
jgi:hypothetical protein